MSIGSIELLFYCFCLSLFDNVGFISVFVDIKFQLHKFIKFGVLFLFSIFAIKDIINKINFNLIKSN